MEKQIDDKSSPTLVPVAIALALAAAIGILFFTSTNHLSVLVWTAHKLYLTVVALLVLSVAAATGARALRAIRCEPGAFAPRLGFSVGIGLGLLSLVTLLLGVLGLLHQTVFIALLAVAALLNVKCIVALLRTGAERVRANGKELPGYAVFLLVVIAIVMCMNLLGALTPPWQYDDLEYHLGAPAQFYQQGRITFLEHNVYSNFPFNVEMWHLAGMVLAKSAYQGAIIGKLIDVGLGLLTALMLWSLANRIFGRPAGDFAAAFFYVSPPLAMLSISAHVEIALTFYFVLGIFAFVEYQKTEKTAWPILAAVACGFAFGCKYTAALLLLLPLLAGMVVNDVLKKSSAASVLKRAALVLGISLALVSPWLIKNVAYTGNPVYPLLWSVFGGRGWSAAQEAMWHKAHFTTGGESLVHFFFSSHYLFPILAFVFIPLLILRGRRQPVVFYLLGYFALCYVLWLSFTYRPARFLLPSAAVLPVLSVGGLMQINRRVGRALVAPLLIFTLAEAGLKATVGGNFDAPLYIGPDEQFFRDNTDFVAGYEASRFLNRDQVPPGAKVLFVGEARTFYCERDFIAPTVFNENVFEDILVAAKTPEDFLASLQKMGITHILINWMEMGRLNETYGAFAKFDKAKFEAFQKACLAEVFRAKYPGSLIVVYVVRPVPG
ncbi:MAG: glycosyltransferase family 39 protein [Planctomycetes bacterium]|nr:glycosyltransferase family 39 protein [Planctomycetota bacterium]